MTTLLAGLEAFDTKTSLASCLKFHFVVEFTNVNNLFSKNLIRNQFDIFDKYFSNSLITRSSLLKCRIFLSINF